jgi:hypothetical protein
VASYVVALNRQLAAKPRAELQVPPWAKRKKRDMVEGTND